MARWLEPDGPTQTEMLRAESFDVARSLLGNIIRRGKWIGKVVGMPQHSITDPEIPVLIQPMREVDNPAEPVDWWDAYTVFTFAADNTN